MIPQSDPDDPWIIMYTADYGCDNLSALGFAYVTPEPLPRPAELPDTGFPHGRETLLPIQPSDKAYSELGDLWLEIPSLDVEVPIVGVPLSGDNWDVSWLKHQAGYLEGTAFPTWPGNTALTSHVYDARGLPGPFVNLRTLSFNERIIIHAGGHMYIYEVRTNQLVRPNDLEVLKHEIFDWVTLLTCQGYSRHTDSYDWRRVVRAVLVSVQQVR